MCMQFHLTNAAKRVLALHFEKIYRIRENLYKAEQIKKDLYKVLNSNKLSKTKTAALCRKIKKIERKECSIGNDLEKTNGGWVCDSAGSGYCWIPWPDEGAIELPIIITIIGTSFAVILVVRRRKSGGNHI